MAKSTSSLASSSESTTSSTGSCLSSSSSLSSSANGVKTISSSSKRTDKREGSQINKWTTVNHSAVDRRKRLAANARERKRMHLLNSAYDHLRRRLADAENKSKYDVLVQAKEYIQALATICEKFDKQNPNHSSVTQHPHFLTQPNPNLHSQQEEKQHQLEQQRPIAISNGHQLAPVNFSTPSPSLPILSPTDSSFVKLETNCSGDGSSCRSSSVSSYSCHSDDERLAPPQAFSGLPLDLATRQQAAPIELTVTNPHTDSNTISYQQINQHHLFYQQKHLGTMNKMHTISCSSLGRRPVY